MAKVTITIEDLGQDRVRVVSDPSVEKLLSIKKGQGLAPSQVQAIIAIGGELTVMDTVEIIKMTVDWLKEAGIVNYVLDLGKCEHIQQTAIEALWARASYLRQYGGDIKIAAPSPYLLKCFNLAGRRNDFRFYTNQTIATAACAKRGHG